MRDSYSKYLRSEKNTTGQETKSLDRYKTWPWANQMEFLRGFLPFAKTHSNIASTEHLSEDANPKDATGCSQDASTSFVRPTPAKLSTEKMKARKSQPAPSSAVEHVISYLDRRRESNESNEDIDIILNGYAKTIKKCSKKRQTLVKYKISKLLMEQELEQIEEDERSSTSSSTVNFPQSPPLMDSYSGSGPSTPYTPNTTYEGESSGQSSSSAWYEDLGANTSMHNL